MSQYLHVVQAHLTLAPLSISCFPPQHGQRSATTKQHTVSSPVQLAKEFQAGEDADLRKSNTHLLNFQDGRDRRFSRGERALIPLSIPTDVEGK